MGVSTDGQICYGINFDEDAVFPWDTEEYEGEIDQWWTYGVLGFRHSFEMFTPEGDWIGGKEWPQEKRDQYYNERWKFEEQNPKLPVQLVTHCSYEYSMYFLAVPGTFKSANRGFPEKFDPAELIVTAEQKTALIEFCQTYGIEFEDEPAWYLSSVWG